MKVARWITGTRPWPIAAVSVFCAKAGLFVNSALMLMQIYYEVLYFRGNRADIRQLSIVHHLLQSYRWLVGFTGPRVELIPQSGTQNENSLAALKSLSPDGEKAWPIMHKLNQALSDIGVDCSVLECEDEPCLLVNLQDEFAVTCHLKNFGVAIAEPFPSNNPF